MAVKKKTFNLANYQVANEIEIKTLKLPDGVEVELKVMELTWKKRNKHLIAASSIDASGTPTFNGPEFAELCLIDMIKEAPWGETTRSFLAQINADLGDALATLVPLPQEEDGGTDTAKK